MKKILLSAIAFIGLGMAAIEADAQFFVMKNGVIVYSELNSTPDSVLFREPIVSYVQTVDGHEAVDLGLPSGTLWATYNIGAQSPTDKGNYYAWGEIEPKQTYDWTTYKFSDAKDPDDWTSITKYTWMDADKNGSWYDGDTFVGDKKRELDDADDVAVQKWGGKWRMPTIAQFYELLDNCPAEWTDSYKGTNVSGTVFYKKVDGKTGYDVFTDVHIFLPAVGNNIYDFYDRRANCWTRTLYTRKSCQAYVLPDRNRESMYCVSYSRSNGLPVRAVYSEVDSQTSQGGSTGGEDVESSGVIVGTLAGHSILTYEELRTVYGSFDKAEGFSENATLKYDPINPKILYICYDGGDRGIEYLDFEKEEYHQLMNKDAFGTDRLRDIAFSLDGKYMIVDVDRWDNETKSPSLFILKRNDEGTFEGATPQILASFKQCNTVAVHPVNGEVYFNSFSNGQLFRLELDDYINAIKENGKIDRNKWDGYQHDEEDEYTKGFHEIFQLPDNDNEYRLCIHPSGNYAYILVINKHYILRTDYD